MNRTVRTEAIIVITALAAAVFVWTGVRALWYAPEKEIPAPALAQAAPSSMVDDKEFPSRLEIPSIDVDAAVQHVGVNGRNEMAAPSNYTDVGWYKYGPVPGQVGSAVIDGHVDNGLSLAGVFKRLGELKVGDSVFIETVSGKRLEFKVTEVKTYAIEDVPTDRLFKDEGGIKLNLITCEGDWLKAQKTYDQRLVVYTELVET